MDQISYFHLPHDIQCFTIEKVTRWNHLRQFLLNYPNTSSIYQCVSKIEPDEDITNMQKWMTLEQMSRFPNLVSMTNPLYIPGEIDQSKFLGQFEEVMEKLAKLEELVLMMELEEILGDTDSVRQTNLLVNLIGNFFHSEMRNQVGRLTVLVNHSALCIIGNRDNFPAGFNYEDQVYLLHHNHLYWELDRKQGGYYGVVTFTGLSTVPVLPSINEQRLSFLDNVEYRQFKVYIYDKSVDFGSLLNSYCKYRSSSAYTYLPIAANNVLALINPRPIGQTLIINDFPLLSIHYISQISNMNRTPSSMMLHTLHNMPLNKIVSSNPPFTKLPNQFRETVGYLLPESSYLIFNITRYSEPLHLDYVVRFSINQINLLINNFPALRSVYLCQDSYIDYLFNNEYSVISRNESPTLIPSKKPSQRLIDLIKSISLLLAIPDFEYLTVIVFSLELAELIAQEYFQDSRVQIHLVR